MFTKVETKMTDYTDQELDDLSYSDEYAEYIMEHGDSARPIGNGDSLLRAMEDNYLFDDFIDSLHPRIQNV